MPEKIIIWRDNYILSLPGANVNCTWHRRWPHGQ